MAPPDPWAPATVQSSNKPNQEFDEFALLGNRTLLTSMYLNQNYYILILIIYYEIYIYMFIYSEPTPDPFDLSHLNNELLGRESHGSSSGKKTPHSFLGENSALVNLDNLVTAPINPAPVAQTKPPSMYFGFVFIIIIFNNVYNFTSNIVLQFM